MFKRFSSLFLLTISSFSVFSQSENSSLLWEISGKGLEKPSYLFGTFHIMCKGDFTVSGILEAKLKQTSQFYGELKMDDPGMQVQLMSKMMMKGQTLQTMIKEPEFSTLSNRFQSITGMSLSMFNNFKPFMALSMLAIKSTTCQETVQPETELMTVAQKNKIPMLGLETIDDQINAIDKEPLDSQVNSLRKMVSNFDSTKNEMLQLSAVYMKRNVDSLYAFMKNTGITDDFETNMLDDRNKRWIPVIQKALEIKPTFFAVGAGHLGGPAGVISLLRKQGYRLTPVKY